MPIFDVDISFLHRVDGGKEEVLLKEEGRCAVGLRRRMDVLRARE